MLLELLCLAASSIQCIEHGALAVVGGGMPLCVHNTAVRFWSCDACVRSVRHALSTGVTLPLAAQLMTAAAPLPAQMRTY